jgi:hypothetical protein
VEISRFTVFTSMRGRMLIPQHNFSGVLK